MTGKIHSKLVEIEKDIKIEMKNSFSKVEMIFDHVLILHN
jgi:hypothetical protein